jgi:hypothetical protein
METHTKVYTDKHKDSGVPNRLGRLAIATHRKPM